MFSGSGSAWRCPFDGPGMFFETELARAEGGRRVSCRQTARAYSAFCVVVGWPCGRVPCRNRSPAGWRKVDLHVKAGAFLAPIGDDRRPSNLTKLGPGSWLSVRGLLAAWPDAVSAFLATRRRSVSVVTLARSRWYCGENGLMVRVVHG